MHRKKLRGATRLHRQVFQGRRLRCSTKHGIEMLLSPGEYVDAKILTNGFYEEEVLAALRGRLSPGECFWDVGSNLGLHALTISKLCPDVSVIAFEPNPEMAELIRACCLRNSLTVEVVETALHDSESKETFFLHEGNQGRSSLHNWDSDPSLQTIEVNAARADYLVETTNLRLPNVIKIDVEGHESQVLEGMRELLSRPQVHTVVFEDEKDETSKARKLLEDYGFKIQTLERMEDTSHPLENYLATRDPEESSSKPWQ